jgi:hypothetical protein
MTWSAISLPFAILVGKVRYRKVIGMTDIPASPYDQAKRSIEALPPADQLRLISELVGRLSGHLERQPHRSLLELRGWVKTFGKALM